MGIQSIQDFIESSTSFSVHLPKYLEDSKLKTSNTLLVHADSCIRQFYHEHIDWVCGGQWNELLQSIEKFVRAFRQNDIQLVVFFDGSLSASSLHNWSSKHRFYRDIVNSTLSHVINNQNVPFRTKTKNFVAPGALKSAFRLAFRSLDVMVCCSLEDIYKESVLFGKDENCLGIVANDANFFIANIPRYINLGNTRWLKKIFTACKVYTYETILKELCLDLKLLPYLAALMGNFMIDDATLSSFYWDLLEEDHPLKKIQVNVVHEAVLPPSEVRLKCVAKFLHNKQDELDDINTLAEIVFGKSTNISVEDGAKKLKVIIGYYQDILEASNSSEVKYDEEESMGLSAAGYPLPSISTQYRKVWEYMEKTNQTNTASAAASKPKVVAEELTSKDTVENPEEVIKQGTLEEAAQALIQLELNEESNAKNTEEKKQDVSGTTENTAESNPVANDEKPSIHNGEPVPTDLIVTYSREIIIKSFMEAINDEVLKVARKRHQSGQMCPEILNLLTKGEIILDVAVDDETTTQRLPIPLIFRPLRQMLYGVLFGTKKTEEKVGTNQNEKSLLLDGSSDVVVASEVLVNGDEKAEISESVGAPNDSSLISDNLSKDTEDVGSKPSTSVMVKEWCIYGEKGLNEPDIVEPKGMNWGVPSLDKLWFGMESEDNANRLKAFLSCMKSDTVNMSNTGMVPQRLMLLCCVLRYLIQQEEGKSILTKQDIDAFLAQALSTQLTMEHNTQNLANIKLSHIDARCIQLSAIFMSGIENAIIANDACGSPIPWEFCCPWNFFDGKLFHSKWLMANMSANTTDLCDGKHHIAEKLERLRWCIVEGLDKKFSIAGLSNQKFFNPFGVSINVTAAPFHGVMRPGGSFPQQQVRARSRGAGSRRTVHGSGGTLHVAGVPVAHWSGNKAGVGYSKNGPGVLVGGPNSVDLPSAHRRGRGRGGARGNRGRGLLQTPFISPWHQGFGFEEYVNNTFQKYMKGVSKAEQFRAKISKINRYQVYSSRTRNQAQTNQGKEQQQQQQQQQQRGNTNVTNNTSWFGKGRGQTKQINDLTVKQQIPAHEPTAFGRGQWINAGE